MILRHGKLMDRVIQYMDNLASHTVSNGVSITASVSELNHDVDSISARPLPKSSRLSTCVSS